MPSIQTVRDAKRKETAAMRIPAAVVLLSLAVCCAQEENRDPKPHPELAKLVTNWAHKLSGELWSFGNLVTRRSKVMESYKDTNVIREDGETILKDIHEKISEMMKQKVKAVERIMDVAENAAKHQKDDDIDVNFQFYNAKNLTNPVREENEPTTKQPHKPETDELKMNDFSSGESFDYQQDQDVDNDDSSKDSEFTPVEIDLEVTDGSEKDPQASQTQPKDKTKLPLYRNRHFYNIPVNTNHSAVHVPSNVYERSKNVISGIIWSEELDKTFRNNYKQDPTLSWQYFGSSTGFMRQFPAMIWSQEPIDLFDCRTRSWYIEAASSPKDVVILVDRSGSMTGMRREIARHVVYNILDTLGNNDYVNIYTFSNTTDPLVPCFEDMLVQANLANVRLLKESMTNFKTEQIANFSDALITAFELLEEYRESEKPKGANCNQAIMLITDGVQYNYKEIFEKYNWGDLPFMNVRVFTYLIGREVSDVREVKWMACANQGYYVHLSTYAEVREEVLQYIPVMARPMVLNANQKPNPTWSPVYADVTDPKLTNWLWVNRERNRQREKFMMKDKALMTVEQDKRFVHQQKIKQDNYGELQTYHLMTSVSLPVYDKKPRAERVANLLGVAGTDIPIEYIKRLMMPYRLGVNGYAFIVTNNGYILTHPDLRPVYQGILKPAYNRVDVTEVEVMDDDNHPREFSDEIRELRNNIVMQKKGNVTLRVKTHVDDMKRLMTFTRHYFYRGINGTPFSLVIALPHRYGFYRVQHKVENDIHRMRSQLDQQMFTQFFTGNWTIHPDWQYCRDLKDNYFNTPEQELLHFLRKMAEPGWKWSSECERKLFCEVVNDAKITSWFSENITTTSKEENGTEFIKRFGITVAFLATHSGLTRWQYFPQNIDPSVHEPNFHNVHNRAIDETWYKRAVEQHYLNPQNFVFSVPFHVGDENHTLVTVSHAIFRENNSKEKAPAAVVGYQLYHSAMYSLFTKITNSCGDISCKRTCESKELHCLMLDDNGYIIISNDLQETGYFFGRVRPDIMDQLVEEEIYKITTMYDYQGLCPESQETTNPASRLMTPLIHIANVLNWSFAKLIYLIRTVTGTELETMTYPEHDDMKEDDMMNEREEEQIENQPTSRSEKELDHRLLIKKTKPEPCDTVMSLYSLVHYNESTIGNSSYSKPMTDCTRPFLVQKISNSNMILLVINNVCRENRERAERTLGLLPEPPKQVDYNMSLSCYRVLNNNFPRRLYMSCINRSSNESEIKLCGAGTKLTPTLIIPLFILLIFHFVS
ncbi:voltage-dependent calcium channel subunit alpha-2/delta-3 isoform X2 [Aethina tumida]|uniref:voltage-dependent calcium channel subunit alpha-2/delta-3 isoform X2 n=1 Tax=Aethina tumida TaxID=116153 RepID=UPI002148A73B|nr:voltage-dependent calcium channel subunit alpha-2/delta-3 isoform X2 [Aethina tumida]